MTIIETMVLVAILVMIVSAIVSSIGYVYRGQRFAFEQADATRSARQGVERAVRDLRESSYADDGAYPIVSMSTSSITFFSDTDNNSRIEKVRYFLGDTNFNKGTTESTGDPPMYESANEVVSLVSDNVRNSALNIPIFTYYDKGGDLMSDYAEVDELGFVLVRVIVNLQPGRAPEDYEMRSSAALRNVK
jgi:type II secretory pathway pseudopilin PulG